VIGILAIDKKISIKKLELYKQKIMMEVKDILFKFLFCNFEIHYVFFSFIQSIWNLYKNFGNPSSKVVVNVFFFFFFFILQIYTTRNHGFS
jgi:hypothetical protein